MKVKTHIRRMLLTHLTKPGDEYEFDTRIAEDSTPRRFQISTTQVRADLPFKTEARKYGFTLIVRRTDWDGEILPGIFAEMSDVDILRSMMPWPDDEMYKQKKETIERCIDLFDN